MAPNMRLLLIRHARSSANAEGRLQGHHDVPLDGHGLRQSELLAERLSALSLDALYTSPLQRASRTAAVIAERNGLEPQPRDGLVERDVGVLAGLTRAEIIERFPEYVRARAELQPKIDIEGYESDEVFIGRAVTAVEAIIAAHPQGTVAAVTHGGVIHSFCRQTLKLPVVRPAPFDINNASISTFDIRDGDYNPRARTRVQLVGLNDTCHLDGHEPAP